MGAPARSDLATELREGLEAQLLGGGWLLDRDERQRTCAPFTAGLLARFTHPSRVGFAGMTTFSWLREDESDALDVAVHTGVEYEPAHELLKSVGSGISGIVLKEPVALVRISSSSGALEAAEDVGRRVASQTPSLDRLAEFDVAIELLREGVGLPFGPRTAGRYVMAALGAASGAPETLDGRQMEGYGQLTCAMFAAAGRYDEAGRALADLLSTELEDRGSLEDRRFVDGMTRFLATCASSSARPDARRAAGASSHPS
jgi:hypothetical protein